MPDLLTPHPFHKGLLPEFQTFWCGSEDYAHEVTEWIGATCDNRALREQKNGVSVWVYRNRADDLVGFGSLGATEWTFDLDGAGERPQAISYLPMMGVHFDHQGCPQGPDEIKYCYQILDHILTEAETFKDARPYVGLSVHPENAEAIQMYTNVGFAHLSFKEGYSRMIIQI